MENSLNFEKVSFDSLVSQLPLQVRPCSTRQGMNLAKPILQLELVVSPIENIVAKENQRKQYSWRLVNCVSYLRHLFVFIAVIRWPVIHYGLVCLGSSVNHLKVIFRYHMWNSMNVAIGRGRTDVILWANHWFKRCGDSFRERNFVVLKQKCTTIITVRKG